MKNCVRSVLLLTILVFAFAAPCLAGDADMPSTNPAPPPPHVEQTAGTYAAAIVVILLRLRF